jgi:hypothetical protein
MGKDFGVSSNFVGVEDSRVIWDDPDDGCERYLIHESGNIKATLGDEMEPCNVAFYLVSDEQGRVFEYGYRNHERFYPLRLNEEFQVMTTLYNKEGNEAANQPVTVVNEKHGYGIGLKLDGYGLVNMDPGFGEVVFLEKYDDKVQLLVWADITQEDPTHTIDLKMAREIYRPEDEEEDLDDNDFFECWNCKEQTQAKGSAKIWAGCSQVPDSQRYARICFDCVEKVPIQSRRIEKGNPVPRLRLKHLKQLDHFDVIGSAGLRTVYMYRKSENCFEVCTAGTYPNTDEFNPIEWHHYWTHNGALLAGKEAFKNIRDELRKRGEVNEDMIEDYNARYKAKQPPEGVEELERVCYECVGKFPARMMIALAHDPDRPADHICVKCNGLKEHESKTGDLFVIAEVLESGFSASGYYTQAQADSAIESLTRAGRYSMGPFVAPAPEDVMAERTLYKMIEDMLSQQTKELLETKDA